MTSVLSWFRLGLHLFLHNPNNRELSRSPPRVVLLCVPAARADVPSPAYWAVCTSSLLRRLAPLGIISPLRSPVGACPSLLQPSRHSHRRHEALPHQSLHFTQRSSGDGDIEPAVQRSLLRVVPCISSITDAMASGLSGRWAAVQRRSHHTSVSTLHCSAAAASATRHPGSQALRLCPCPTRGTSSVHTAAKQRLHTMCSTDCPRELQIADECEMAWSSSRNRGTSEKSS